MDLYLGQRVALGPRTGAIIDIRSPSSVSVHFDSGGVEDVDPNTLHYAELDYPELEGAVWDHPSPEKALDGDPYINLRSKYRPRQKTATDSTSLPSSVSGDTGQMHADNQALSGPPLGIDFIPLEPGIMCSYCGINQAECTVNQATLCLDCAENRWGIPVQEAMADPGVPGDAPQEPSAAMEPDPRTVDAIEKTGGLVDWLLGKVTPLAPGAPRFESNWCRFRSSDRCWKSGVLDTAATQQMGYAVWAPRDMGPCGRATVAAQKACGHSDWGPGSEPGPGSNDPQSLTNATVPFSEGGQRDGTPGPAYRFASHDPEMEKALDELGELLKPSGHRTSSPPEKEPSMYGGYISGPHANGKLYINDEKGSRPVEKLYRVVHPKEWEEAQEKGYLQSQSPLSPGYTRASAQPSETFRHQSMDPLEKPPRGHTLEIDYHPDDGWRASAEGYASTFNKIPLSRVRRVGGLHEAMATYTGNHFFIFHKANPKAMNGMTYHTVEAWDKDQPEAHVHPSDRNPYLHSSAPQDVPKPIGSLNWKAGTGEIENVSVHPDFQRQGLATELLRQAQGVASTTRGIKPPRHSSDRTKDGDAWAHSLSEKKLPKLDDWHQVVLDWEKEKYGDLTDNSHTSSWRDVVDKAKRLRETNAVHILETPTPQSPYVFAEVKGDTATHHCFVSVKGDEQGQWSCSCPWGDYGPNGPLAEERKVPRYKKTPCFLPGSLVSMADGTYKPIEEVVAGDRVLTHDGVGVVEHLYQSDYEGHAIEVTTVGASFPMLLTADHGVMAADRRGGTVRRTEAQVLTTGSWLLKTYPDEEYPLKLDLMDLPGDFVEVDGEARWRRVGTYNPPKSIGRWSREFGSCTKCGTMEIGHHAKGLCHRCYDRDKWGYETERPASYGIGKVETRKKFPSHHEPLNNNIGLPRWVVASEDWMKIFGYYLAEGSVGYYNPKGAGRSQRHPNIVEWTFHSKEASTLAERLRRALRAVGADSVCTYQGKNIKKNALVVKCSNTTLAVLLKMLFGAGAPTKTVHPSLMVMEKMWQKSLLKYYCEGDGHTGRSGQQIVDTASGVLARQIVTLGARTGFGVPTLSHYRNPGGPTNRDKECWINRVTFPQYHMVGRERTRDGYYAARVKSLKSFEYRGSVYNLSVDHQHTYAVEDHVVFNCSHVLATRWELQSRSMFGRNPYTGALFTAEDHQLEMFHGHPTDEPLGHRTYVPLYHGTRWPLKPGDMLSPEGGKNKSSWGYGSTDDHVYLTPSHDSAQGFAEAGSGPPGNYDAKPHVYQVENTGPLEEDTDEPGFPSLKTKHPVRVVKRVSAMNAEGEVPPKMGESPIPEGTIRLYHNTWPSSVPSIREHGLLQSHAVGDSGQGYGNEPSAGIWAATKHPAGDDKMEGPHPDGDRHTVEFWAHPHQISQNADHFWGEDPQKWAERSSHHVIMNSDISPSQIAAIHEPWHTAYHMIKEDPRHLEETKSGGNDWMIDHPDFGKNYGTAVEKIKREGSLHIAVNGPDEVPAEMGTTPIPKDHVRFFHYTNPENVESIRQHGILHDKASGAEGPKGIVWATTGRPLASEDVKPVVEFHLPHKDIAHFDRRSTAEDYGPENTQSVPLGPIDVHPSSIIAIHEPWHGHYRYMNSDPEVREAVKNGEHDSLAGVPEYGPAIDKIKREAAVYDPLDDWFDGRFLHEARGSSDPSTLEHYMAPHRHPAGEEWSTETMSGTYPNNPRATHFEDLPDHDQTEVAGKVHKALSEAPTIPNTSAGGARNPLPAKPYDPPQTHDDISHNIEDMFHSARTADENEGTHYLSSGRKWYKQAHGQVHKWAKKYDIDPHRMAAATACLSPSTDWDSNLTMAHYYVKHLGKAGQANNESFRMDKSHPKYQEDSDKAKANGVEDLDGLEGKRFSDMTDMEAHHAVKHQAMRVDKVTKAYGGNLVEEPEKGTSWQGGKFGARAAGIIREHTDPDQALSGHKVRSFYNNIYHPGKTDDVTVDSHATSLAVGAKMGAESKTLGKVLEFGGSDRERKHNSLGGYSYFASAYRKAHTNLVASGHMDAKSTPADLQAITWKRWRDLMPAAVAGKKGHIPSLYTPKDAYPVLASSQGIYGDDSDEDFPVDESPERYLDPFGGLDEPDPDLHAREEPDWEDAPEDNEGDEDDDGLPKVGAMYDWNEMLRQARREQLAAEVAAQQVQAPQVPVQYLSQVPHHLSSGYDEWGFEAPVHQAGVAPSEQWQEAHSPGANNPADTAPHGFGDPLDPNFRPSALDRPYSDEQLLEPGGVATGGPFRSHMPAGYEVMTGSVRQPPQPPRPAPQPSIPPGMSPEAARVLVEHQAALDYLRPPEGTPSGFPGASPGSGSVSREAALAQDQQDKARFASAAEQFLQTGFIPNPETMINMDTIFSLPPEVIRREARSRDFSPSEQEEMVKEGELEGVRASNYGLLSLSGTMYEELERQLSTEENSEAAANALWW